MIDAKLIYDYFALSGGEKCMFTACISDEGFMVDISLPSRVSNEQIAQLFIERMPSIYIAGMNKNTGSVVVPTKTICGSVIDIYFNRAGVK